MAPDVHYGKPWLFVKGVLKPWRFSCSEKLGFLCCFFSFVFLGWMHCWMPEFLCSSCLNILEVGQGVPRWLLTLRPACVHPSNASHVCFLPRGSRSSLACDRREQVPSSTTPGWLKRSPAKGLTFGDLIFSGWKAWICLRTLEKIKIIPKRPKKERPKIENHQKSKSFEKCLSAKLSPGKALKSHHFESKPARIGYLRALLKCDKSLGKIHIVSTTLLGFA